MCEFCGSNKLYAKGYCHACYQRYIRNGTSDYKINMKKIQTGDRFEKLEVVEILENNCVKCKCDCGNY